MLSGLDLHNQVDGHNNDIRADEEHSPWPANPEIIQRHDNERRREERQ